MRAVIVGRAVTGWFTDSSAWPPAAIIAVALLCALGLAYWGFRRRRTDTGAGPKSSTGESTIDELDRRADLMLVRTDDALRTSEQDLEFARAESGDDAVATFVAALEEANEHLDRTFRLREQLDESSSAGTAARRKILEEMLQRLADANESLDGRASAFDKLRALEENTSVLLDTVMAVATEARARLNQTRSSLAAMSERYSASALEAVAGNDDQAADRLEFAGSAAATAREKLVAGDRAAAAVATLAAQHAAAQADHLMEAVDKLAADLAEAGRGLEDAVKQTAQDLAEARELLAGGPEPRDLVGQVAAAEHILSRIRRELESGTVDPIGAIKNIERADQSLRGVLESGRDDDARIARAEARLDVSMLAARAEISAATDYITTHRGGVGAEARTRLAEARRSLAEAQDRLRTDSITALKLAHRAHERASRALHLALGEAGAFPPQVGVLGGAGLKAAMLGGILIRTGPGGSSGSGGSDDLRDVSGPDAASYGPGSFGGVGTRGRRGEYPATVR